jgi:hypothetical protein
MIQRIQTVYLFFGALALCTLGLFDLPWNSAAATTHAWFVPSLIGLILATAGTAIGAIFLYENRPTQRTVVVGVQIGTLLLAGVLYGGLYLTSELAFSTEQGIDWARTTTLSLPIVAYALFLLARRGITHDIELVESMDRLR